MEVDRPPRTGLKVWAALGLVVVALLIGAVALLGGEGGDSEDFVSEDEARSFLDQAVAAARARDWDRLCNLNGAPPNCHFALNSPFQNLRDTLPPDPPRIVETRFLEESAEGAGGRILIVEGTDGRGKSYRTEVLVSRYEGKLEGTNIVYWSSHEIFDRERNERRLRESKP